MPSKVLVGKVCKVLFKVTRRFDESPERVFDTWLKPKIMSKWLFTEKAD
jgi:uncharacterized protein YndB with AHSA1/START domain